MYFFVSEKIYLPTSTEVKYPKGGTTSRYQIIPIPFTQQHQSSSQSQACFPFQQ